MRASFRWASTLLLAALALVLTPAAPSWAASPTLTPSPATGPAGTKVTLTYDGHTDQQTCPPAQNNDDSVRFSEGGTVLGDRPFNANMCTAKLVFTIPTSGAGSTCGPHPLTATPRYAVQQNDDTAYTATASFTVTCPKPTKSPLPIPTVVPTRTHSASPTPSQTASPTPSPTPSATPSRTPTPTPTATFAPVTSASPVAAVSPPDFPVPGGSSGTPWIVGGAVLGLAGLGGSLVFLRPKAGTPIVVGGCVLSVLAGGGVALLAPADQPKSMIIGSYTVGNGEGCAKGDIPVNGGFYGPDTPAGLLRFYPSGSSSDTGSFQTSFSLVGQGSTVCLRLGRSVVWRVRDATVEPTTANGGVSCQIPESLLGGGFAIPWGISALASHPEAPMRWSISNAPYTDGPAPPAIVSALCAELPDGLRTYVTTASTAGAGVATARCFPGDAVLNGGYAGRAVQGSYPVDGGWAARLGDGGGSAYAICFHPSRTFGLRSTSAHAGSVHAECSGADTVLAGGWDSGTDLDGLQHFEPSGNQWTVERPVGASTAYVLCARHY